LVRAFVGLSIKIHAVVDALGNPLSFHLSPGQASDLEGADQLLGDVIADTVLADKAYEQVIERLQAQGKTVVIPPRRNRKQPRDYMAQLMTRPKFLEQIYPFSSID
jgi:transposase